MIFKLVISKYKVLLLFIYLIPVAILVWFVSSFGVNVPFLDQWDLVRLFEKISTGTANFGDFFAQHNEHRIFFPKLIIAALAFLSSWNVFYELYFSIFLTTITFFALYKLSYLKLENSSRTSNDISIQITNILTCILLFSLVQYGNWLWGFQIAWFLINTCLATAILMITSSYLHPNRFYFAAIPCFIASFSSAHGLLTWLAVIPSIASLKGSSRQKKIRFVTWILLFVGTCAIYFTGYQKPSDRPSIFLFLKEPLAAANYFFSLLGTPLTVGFQFIPALIVGLIIFLTYLFFAIRFFNKRQKFQLNPDIAPWISLGLFAFLFAAINTVGRISLGISQATSPTYTTSSILILISIVHLWRLFSFRKGVLASSIIIVLIFLNSTPIVAQGNWLHLLRRASTSCLELINYIDGSPKCLLELYPSIGKLRELAVLIEKVGFRKFPNNVSFVTNPTEVYGYIDSPPVEPTPFTITLSKAKDFHVGGWATLPNSLEPFPTVLLSYGSSRIFFGSTVVRFDSPDVAKAFNSSKYSKVRWSTDVPSRSLPIGETEIQGWIYDSANKQIVKLGNEPRIRVDFQVPIQEIAVITNPSRIYGYIDNFGSRETVINKGNNDSLQATGWAILPDSLEIPKTVLLSYGKNRSFFTSTSVNLNSPDVAAALKVNYYSKVRWAVNISSSSLPIGETAIQAWVYDPYIDKLVKLNGEFRVNVVK